MPLPVPTRAVALWRREEAGALVVLIIAAGPAVSAVPAAEGMQAAARGARVGRLISS